LARAVDRRGCWAIIETGFEVFEDRIVWSSAPAIIALGRLGSKSITKVMVPEGGSNSLG